MKKLLIILFVCICQFTFAAKHYVSTSGNNGNTGHSEGQAWLTLQYAEDNATAAGDTICLKKGDNFAYTLALGIQHGGSAGLPIVWDGSLWGSGANAIISSTDDREDTDFAIVSITGCHYVTFENITVDGDGYNCYGIVIGGGTDNVMAPGAVQNDERYITIQDCSIIDIGSGTDYGISLLVQTWHNDMYNITVQRNSINGVTAWGISFYMGYTYGASNAHCYDSYIGYNTVTNCGMNDDGRGTAIGGSGGVERCTVEHNTVTQGTGHAMLMGWGGGVSNTYTPKDIIIRYNDVRSSDQPCLYIQHGTAMSIDTYYNLFYGSALNSSVGAITVSIWASPNYTGAEFNFWNNVIVVAQRPAFQDESSGGAGICHFQNNILISTSVTEGSDPLVTVNTAGTTHHDHNSYFRTLATGDPLHVIDVSYYYRSNLVGSYEATAIVTDPLLTNRAGFDWTLQAASPCIDAGVDVGLSLERDYIGAIIGVAPDMGAYEYGATPPDVPPDLPVVVSSSIQSGWTAIWAITGGAVTDDGGGTVTARGVCWSKSVNPTISDAHTHDGTGEGNFTSTMTGLNGNVSYYVRAYATNATGTTYGANIGFTTPIVSRLRIGGKYIKHNGKYLIISR